MRGTRGSIRNELIAGLVAVTLLSGIMTYVGTLVWSRRNFDTLVQNSDLAIAKSVAEKLAPYFGAHGSWNGIGTEIDRLGTGLPREDAEGPGGGTRPRKKNGFPLVLTDTEGNQIYPEGWQDGRANGMQGNRFRGGRGDVQRRTLALRYRTSRGAEVVWNGATVGYVFYKSMLLQSYNLHEAEFLASLITSIGISVTVGIVFAILLGLLLAARFSRPVTLLDEAVQKLAAGELGVRARVGGTNEIGRLAGNFNAMAERLEANETARRNLLADMAHELRTPVSIIQANLEMILDGVYVADTGRLKSLYEETRILTDLIGNLRAISDLEVGIVPVTPEPVPVFQLLDETCRTYRPLFDGKGIDLHLACGDGGIRVSSEEARLRQVLRNILVNALKYAPAGSTVTVSCGPSGGESAAGSGSAGAAAGTCPAASLFRITVADEGPGVPEADLGRIFERFYRVDPSRNRESGGRGLGLAICRQFIEASGGSIRARNREPHGLEVTVDLPVDAAGTPPEPAVPPRPA